MRANNNNSSHGDYIEKVWIAVGIAALVVVVLLLIKATFNVFLLSKVPTKHRQPVYQPENHYWLAFRKTSNHSLQLTA